MSSVILPEQSDIFSERALGGQPTGCIALADGSLFFGHGFGATGTAVGELCFNTAMTGYQEVMTDPSYAGQMITFTFPHIGNVGTNPEDDETADPVALGMVVKWDVTEPSNWRAADHLSAWLARRGRIGVSGIDTRRVTRRIRDLGMPHAALAHAADGVFDTAALIARAQAFEGLEGVDLAKGVTCAQSYRWDEVRWAWGQEGFARATAPRHKVVAIDYGAKRNILRCLASAGCDVTVLPATATADEVLAHKPDGVFLSNGPGDPAATGVYAVPMIQGVLAAGTPIFGICLGHQMLALALGGKTLKMNHGHHGANHPVKDLETGKVEITSMNHGFAVDAASLPDGVIQTHASLFDGSNCGIRAEGRPVFSVQYHPEASPGPQDSAYLFERFTAAMAER
ncbi:MAG: glutamine-hydrolyzing carbamoyl-phosphate synthase small subunit, partial [Hyphomicrobiales bacterium]